jgi:hypothetical protein
MIAILGWGGLVSFMFRLVVPCSLIRRIMVRGRVGISLFVTSMTSFRTNHKDETKQCGKHNSTQEEGDDPSDCLIDGLCH